MNNEDLAPKPASKMADSTFPKRLARIIGNSSVRAFARRASVSDTFVRQCLGGRTEPTRTKLIALAEAGDVSVQWLATGCEIPGRRATPPDDEPGAATECANSPEPASLESIIEMVETLLDDVDRPLSPTRKARLICTAYEMRTSHDVRSLLAEHLRELVGNAG